MLTQQTVALLHTLKLHGMAHAFTERLASPQHADLSHAEFVALLVHEEKTYRDNQRLTRLLKNAKLKQQATLEDLDYSHPRGLAKAVMLELSTGQWIRAPRNVLLTGPTGVGKSYVAQALGHLAARAGFPVLYVRAPRLFESLQQARGDGSHLKLLTKLGKLPVLILDDLLLTPLTDAERKDLLEIVEDRYGTTATVITSQCPLKEWHRHMGDPTLADAICDRLLHTAYKIELKGESIRKVKRESRPGADA
jgi:DNA replication protein DnaC